MSSALLSADRIGVAIGRRTIVQDASLALRAGELVALVGPNGAGKTTLIRALAGLLPAAGRIELDGRALAEMPVRERARRMAYLPQGAVFHWPLPVATVVALGRTPHGDPFAQTGEQDRAAIARALERTGLAALAGRPVTSLSGGERARVALARALATEASVLLADEPTVSLYPRHQLVVMGLLRDAAKAGGAVLAVVHDLALAARFADRVAVMQDGRIVADAPPAEALTAERLAATFGIDATMVHTGEGPLPVARRAL
jgi:iron complex transport system ATP-binding protein